LEGNASVDHVRCPSYAEGVGYPPHRFSMNTGNTRSQCTRNWNCGASAPPRGIACSVRLSRAPDRMARRRRARRACSSSHRPLPPWRERARTFVAPRSTAPEAIGHRKATGRWLRSVPAGACPADRPRTDRAATRADRQKSANRFHKRVARPPDVKGLSGDPKLVRCSPRLGRARLFGLLLSRRRACRMLESTCRLRLQRHDVTARRFLLSRERLEYAP
jgi:hypothetical protein